MNLRLPTEVLVYAPVSDAFSGSVSQALACGTVAIIGSWPPYKARARAGFKYHEIDSPSDAGECLGKVIENLEIESLQSSGNRQLSLDFFSAQRIGTQWVGVYESAIQ